MANARGAIAAGLGLGVGLMYFLDPDRGARRRARVRDQLMHASRCTGEFAGVATRDITQRLSGVAARLRSAGDRRRVDDDILIERARAKLGRVVSHPHAIRIDALDGMLTVRGPILQSEMKPLLHALEGVRGVGQVVSHLEVHESPVGASTLESRHASRETKRRAWSPTTRVIAGATGTALAATGLALYARSARGSSLWEEEYDVLA
jgi:hypothetical protein